MNFFGKLIFGVSGACFGAAVAAEPLEILNWTDFFSEDALESYQAQTGNEVLISPYLEANEAEGLLLARAGRYDLAVIPNEVIGRLVEGEALAPIPSDAVTRRADHEQGLMPMLQAVHPAVADYAVPYVWGTTGLVYSVSAVRERLPDAPLDSWALIFDPNNAEKLADCGISIVSSSDEVLALVLAYLGRDPGSHKPEDVDAAFAVLESIAPYVRYFDTEQYDALVEEEICLALAWSSAGFAPMIENDNDDYQFMVPKEGGNLWADMFVIPSEAPRPDASIAFIDYMGQPEPMALNMQYVYGAVRSDALRGHIDDDTFDHPLLRLPEEVLARLFVVAPWDGAAKQALDRRWRRMVLGQ